MSTGMRDLEIRCSFCTKSKDEVEKVIAGAGVYICDECVALCYAVLELPRESTPAAEIPWPDAMSDEEILEYLPRMAAISAQVDANLRACVERLRERGVS